MASSPPGGASIAGNEPAWPRAVLDAPLLRGLDARALREIAEAGSLATLREGETVFRAGDRGTSLYVVAAGRVALRAVRRGDGAETAIREAGEGDALGEEAAVGMAHRASAVAIAPTTLAEIPVHVFRRAAARSGRAGVAERLERALRRAATLDLLRTSALTRDLPDDELERLLDAARYRELARGEAVYRAGDPADDVWLVADGMVQLQTEEADDRLRVRAYLARGDFFGDEEVLERVPRATSAVGSGPSLLVALPAAAVVRLAASQPERLDRVRRFAAERLEAQRALVAGAAANATQHAFRDLYRLNAARSLLAIDLDSCVRCGHCAWTCGELYGVARLVRRGDRMVARFADDGPGAAPTPLLLPTSCQHCESPACMIECPTGAIGRKPAGDVFIREALCTGCGACAKACPWDNIQLAPRPAGAPRPTGGAYPEVAVKCDLCRDHAGGPACVDACPTGSIVRVDPSEDLVEVRALVRGAGALGAEGSEAAEARRARGTGARALARSSARPAVTTGAAMVGAAIALAGARMQADVRIRSGTGPGLAAGWLAAAGFVALLAYAVPKRLPLLPRWWTRAARAAGAWGASPRRPRASGPAAGSRLCAHATAHVAIGLVTAGFAVAHAPWPMRPRPSAGFALFVAFAASSLLGVLTAVAYRLVPSRLSRIERTPALPEDFATIRSSLSDRLYRQTSGRSEIVKKLAERVLLPYATSAFGPVALVLSGRTLHEEQRALRARIDALLGGGSSDPRAAPSKRAIASGEAPAPALARDDPRLDGLDDLVRTVVELRALPAQRLLLVVLRAGLPAHVIAFAIATALLVVHVGGALGRP